MSLFKSLVFDFKLAQAQACCTKIMKQEVGLETVLMFGAVAN